MEPAPCKQIKKWNEEIVFLYKVIDGISEGSFGIHVANLAGINESIVSRAKDVLKKTNKKESLALKDTKSFEFYKKKENKNYNEIVNLIKKLDLDDLSPKDSLDILYTIKKNYLS